MREDGFLRRLMGDGRPLLALVALGLVAAGGFALFVSARGEFLPHDVDFLGMQATGLCAINQCRVVHFMFHDRVSFGGVLIAIGVLYLWLIVFPLKEGEAWAWWALLGSGVAGFLSFLSYFEFGYLDTWHLMATLVLLPCFVAGMVRTKRRLRGDAGVGCLVRAGRGQKLDSGRLCWLLLAVGMLGAGLTIMTVGMTRVFVPTDLEFLRLTVADLRRINPRLVPLIAHDRAGFGGGLISCGLVFLACVWCGRVSRSQWEAIGLAGTTGFATAIGIHPLIGYTSWVHLFPAYLGAVVFVVGLVARIGKGWGEKNRAGENTGIANQSKEPEF